MKKTILSLLVVTSLSAGAQKTIVVGQTLPGWSIYFRNIERLNSMAGRVVPSDILQNTRDTVAMFQQSFVGQLNLQLDSTKPKEIKPKK